MDYFIVDSEHAPNNQDEPKGNPGEGTASLFQTEELWNVTAAAAAEAGPEVPSSLLVTTSSSRFTAAGGLYRLTLLEELPTGLVRI